MKNLSFNGTGVEPATHGFSAKQMESAFSRDLPVISSNLATKTTYFNPFLNPHFYAVFGGAFAHKRYKYGIKRAVQKWYWMTIERLAKQFFLERVNPSFRPSHQIIDTGHR